MAPTNWIDEFRQGLKLLGIGLVGALAADRLGLPAGMTVGALISTGIYRLAGGEPGPWREHYGRLGRLLLGAVVGSAFGPDVIAPLQAALLPMMAIIAVLVGTGLGLGWLLSRFTRLDVATALLSAVPGGLPAMASMSEELDSDATVVAAIHFFRLTAILLLVPLLVPLLGGPSAAPAHRVEELAPAGPANTAATLLLAVAGGLLFVRLRVITGDLVGGILIVGGANLLGLGLGPLHAVFRQTAIMLIGIAVGAKMSRESLQQLRDVALAAAALLATMIALGLLLGWGLSQVTPLDLPTALLSSVPGGASTMPAVAHDLGGDIRLVAALHLMRQLVVLIIVPLALGHLLRQQHDSDHSSGQSSDQSSDQSEANRRPPPQVKETSKRLSD
jgi:hypothetical protein